MLVQVLVTLFTVVVSLTVTPGTEPNPGYLGIAQKAIQGDNRLGILGGSVFGRGNIDTFGSYTNGPFGIGPGAMHATGPVENAVAGRNPDTEYGKLINEPNTRCGVNNEAWEIAQLNFTITTTAQITDLQVNFVFALQEPAGRNPDSMQITFDTFNEQPFDGIPWLSSSSPLITATPPGTDEI
nr:uncharacterized protein CTRU02_02268 [Colletotrichum truncatum]KAF6798295.1 hypothetical protein CTRU02_02268 [Colletotrichum truncatum]